MTPVVVGTAAAGHAEAWRFAAALLVGLGLQVGVNYANDYHDGVRGVDTSERIGPPRLTSSGMASPGSVLIAALACIGVAGLAGLALAAATTWWLVPLGAFAMLALWLYSGGPRPYAQLGLGEVMVFAFFGVMATAGTAYVQAETVPSAAWWASAAMGFLAVAILVVNNLRDIDTDRQAKKHTLAVLLGDRATRAEYVILIVGAYLSMPLLMLAGSGPWIWLSWLSLPLAIDDLRTIISGTRGRALNPVLKHTSRLHLAFGALLALGLLLGR